MITDKDTRALKRSTSLTVRAIILAVLPLVSIIGLMTAYLNLALSSRIASDMGLTLGDILSRWMGGLDPSTQYSGSIVMAVEGLRLGVTTAVFSVLLLVMVPILWRRYRRNQRILNFIESGGAPGSVPGDESEEMKEKLKSLGYLG